MLGFFAVIKTIGVIKTGDRGLLLILWLMLSSLFMIQFFTFSAFLLETWWLHLIIFSSYSWKVAERSL